ncbi:mechanosensitive ion channel [Desulfuromonas carbonis]|uniref:mechanosensitive ion channel family protein n=1 Tax=Desulfuromonas sp. DDH964 TaxID=1823759 RepID=UPI00078B49E0|nr:mechanosensitive ion channel domain-containing protein [Desulfuromonas sp. DDH964]AMV71979.1 mechanosensitive ion channel family protein [Desulfuromonas sp. DDH964]
MEQASTLTLTYGPRILAALVILVLGIWAARFFARLTRGLMNRRSVDPTLVIFGSNLLNAALVTFAIIAALGQLGVQTTSLIAVIGAAGLAIGLALQNSLSNFAAGVMILLFHPFRVGDVIEGAGVIGAVEELHIFTTQLKTGDNKTVFIPNGKLMGDNIVNYSKKGTRRLDLVIGVGYRDDLRRVKEVLQALLKEDPRVLADPAPTVAVLELGASSVNFAVRPWVAVDDYWDLHFDTLERIKLRFDAEGISIPFPQRDVHLFPVEKAS